jgi:hypothetical protein
MLLLNPYLDDDDVIAFLFVDPMKASGDLVTVCTTSINIKDSTFFPHRIFLYRWILKTASYQFPNSVSRLISMIDKHIVFCWC